MVGGIAPGDEAAPLEDAPAPRARRRGRWIAGATAGALIVAAIAVIAASSTGSAHHDARSPLQVLAAATARTTAGTVHAELVERLDTGTVTGITTRGALDEDLHHDHSQATYSLAVPNDATLDKTKIELRIVDGKEYVTESGIDLPHHAHWVGGPESQAASSSAAFGSTDPASGLDYLSARKRNPRATGRVTIDGDDTTEYAFDLDLAAVTERAAQQHHQKLTASDRRALDSLRRVPARAWVDTSDHVRRFSLAVAVTEGDEHTRESIRIDYSRFGEHFSVHPPDPRDTISSAEYQAYLKAHPEAG